MEEDSGPRTVDVVEDPPATPGEQVPTEETETENAECEPPKSSDVATDTNESGVVLENGEGFKPIASKDAKVVPFEPEVCEVSEDIRSLVDLDSLPVADELALAAAGSDSGVEGCGRALSSGGGSRSCASSVVSCGSGCGSESSSIAGAPPRPRRRVNVAVTDPPKRNSPLSASTPRPVTAPRGPNLATRERARSREKPTPPEKPRPLTPKPRIRPTGELPNLVRESPALRAKPTKTSSARCRTPNSPSEEKRWPSNGPRLSNVMDTSAARVAADKYGTLPRRRREANEPECSPKHDINPPISRRPTVTRSISSRSTTKTRVRIYAEKNSQTVLIGSDVESALAGVAPSIESRLEVTRCHRGVQASSRDSELARLTAAAAQAEAAAAEERERRLRAEAQLAEERAARLAVHAELERNSLRLLELAGAGAGAGADGCLRALEEQLKAAGELAARQQREIDSLREHCNKLHTESCSSRESLRALQARLAEAEREAAEMQDFLAAETGALNDSLREAEHELARANQDLDRRRTECRQLVRMCEQRRQEALAASARARALSAGGGAVHALDALAKRMRTLTEAVARAYRLPRDQLEPTVYHNDAYSRSDSGDALSPAEECPRGSGLLGAVALALRPASATRQDDLSRASDDNDNSAELLDSETEPCLVTDPECAEEWWSGAEYAGGAWSGEELSPVRDEGGAAAVEGEGGSLSERDSLRNLSAAIAHRQRSEAEDERGCLLERVLAVDNRLTELLRALRLAAAAAAHTDDADSMRLANALRDKIDITEKNVADVVVKKLAELDASKSMMDQYRHSVETLKKQLAQYDEENLDLLEEEVLECSESERRERYEALDAALGALSARQATVCGWGRLATLHASLERLAFALASAAQPAPLAAPPVPPRPAPLHTPA